MIFIALGYSGAGKDTVFEALDPLIKNVKWSQIIKDTLEAWYDLPSGSFNDRHFRDTHKLPNGKTPLQLLIDCYHAWDLIDPALTARPTIKQCEQHILSGSQLPLLFTDTRKLEEVDLLLDMANNLEQRIVLLTIASPYAQQKTSDSLVPQIRESLLSGSKDIVEYYLVNYRTPEFKAEVRAIFYRETSK